MATIPRSYIDNFTEAINALSDDAKAKLAKALERVDDTVTYDALVEIMETLLSPYTDSAAAVAATFYDGLREWYGIDDGFYATSEGVRVPYITEGTVSKVMDGNNVAVLTEDMQAALLDQIDYEVRRTANLTIERNARLDPRKPKYARVPSVTPSVYDPWSKKRGVTHNKFLAETGTCMFCTMLASRGFAYHTAETASHAHPDCDCRIVPSWDKKNPTVEGYDPDMYYDMWKHPEKYMSSDDASAKSMLERQFARVDSIDAAQRLAEQFVDTSAYKSKIDLGGMSVDAANSLLKVLDSVYASYDVEPLRSIQRMNKRSAQFKNTTADAAYQWMLGDLFYNADYVKTVRAMLAHRRDGRQLVDDVLGMDIDAYIRKNAGKKSKIDYALALRDTRRAIVAQSYENYEEITYAHEMGHMLDDRLFGREKGFDRQASFERYGRGISAYASTGVREYIAESFSAYYAGETESLDPELVAIFERMKKHG
jgi:hypothetical protein